MQANELMEENETAAIEELEGEFGPIPISKLEVIVQEKAHRTTQNMLLTFLFFKNVSLVGMRH